MIHLTIDEHTGEAGFVTRIEAFVDMLIRRQRKQLEEKFPHKQNIEIAKKQDKERVLTNSIR